MSAPPDVDLRIVDADDPDLLGLVAAYYDELRVRMAGFDPPSAAQQRSDAARGVVLVAHDGAGPVACGALRLLDPRIAEVKRMFVLPRARGRGIARVVLRALEEHARARSCGRVVLDTGEPLDEAVRLYLREGYVAIPRYNDNPFAARWFAKELEPQRQKLP